jgi:hypothetical protein
MLALFETSSIRLLFVQALISKLIVIVPQVAVFGLVKTIVVVDSCVWSLVVFTLVSAIYFSYVHKEFLSK